MRLPIYGTIAGLALLTIAGQPHAYGGTRHEAMSRAVSVVAVAHDPSPDADGLFLTGEMLFGGVLLIAGSAYALRRSRR